MRVVVPVLVLTVLLTLSSSALAVSVEGTVREAGTRRPVPGAMVQLVDVDDPVVTDDTGAFVLSLPDTRQRGTAVVVEVDDGPDPGDARAPADHRRVVVVVV